MRNILEIFKRDIVRIKTNVIALLVILGITIVPPLYAWFNIAASWDPYGNTSSLKVAVASVDEGYEGDLIPLNINIGDNVLSALRENTQLDWVFTTKDKATKGVKSGKYYAAVIIPENFSKDMMSIFSSDIENPKITYYYNAKENAIAPKITDKGASAIQKQVNSVFIETISETALVALQSVSDMADESGADVILNNLLNNLSAISNDLTAASGTIQSFSNLTGSAKNMLDTTSEFLTESKTHSDSNLASLKNTKNSFSDVKTSISGATDGINAAISGSQSFYTQLSSIIDDAFASQSGSAETLANTLNGLGDKITPIINGYQTLSQAFSDLKNTLPDELPSGIADELDSIIRRLNSAVATQQNLQNKLYQSAQDIQNSPANIAAAKAELDQLIQTSSNSLVSIKNDYENNVENSLNTLFDSLGTTSSTISTLFTQLDTTADNIHKLSGSASSDLAKIQTTLSDTSALIDKTSKRMNTTIAQLKKIKSSGDYKQLQQILSGNSETIASFLSSPVTLKTHEIYPVANYGSAMAPFYSVLSIWVGGIVLVAILKVTVSASSTAGLKNLKPYQVYLGRYPIFLIVGLLQTTLICLGDLYYLQIQCEHPFLFLLAGWFSSIVYVNIIYTLTVSFGDIGKAICVVLLVVQVAGSGGTFPIETAPPFFRAVYPLLPFVHSMTAMRECVAGMYGSTYWIQMGILGIFLIISLFFGLVLRNPIIKLNDAFMEKLESTHLI